MIVALAAFFLLPAFAEDQQEGDQARLTLKEPVVDVLPAESSSLFSRVRLAYSTNTKVASLSSERKK